MKERRPRNATRPLESTCAYPIHPLDTLTGEELRHAVRLLRWELIELPIAVTRDDLAALERAETRLRNARKENGTL